jgi:hypothetical protein
MTPKAVGTLAGMVPEGGGSVNGSIVTTTLVITGLGAYEAISKKKGVGPVLIGGYILMLVLSLAELIPGVSGIVSGIAWVALLAMLIGSQATKDLLALFGQRTNSGSTPGEGGKQ